MTESFQIADWILCGIAIVATVLGLFRGFSGTLGFAAGSCAAFFAATFGWALSADFTEVWWMRGAGVLVAALLVFGLVRLVVKKLVNGLLAQPTDALAGALVGLVLAALLLVAWARAGVYLEYSFLAQALASRLL